MARLAGLKSYFPIDTPRLARRVQVMPDHGCIYVKNPKAGSSSILLWLYRIHSGHHDFEPTTTVRNDIALPRSGRYTDREILRMLNGAAHRFTFVRHPARRLESAYRNKIAKVGPNGGLRYKVQRALGLPEGVDHEVSFEQFIDSLTAVDPLELDLHWRPQHLNLMHPKVSYDLIGRVETFETDLKRLASECGMPHVAPDVRNPSDKSQPLLEGRSDLARKVEDFYALDYELYGYT